MDVARRLLGAVVPGDSGESDNDAVRARGPGPRPARDGVLARRGRAEREIRSGPCVQPFPAKLSRVGFHGRRRRVERDVGDGAGDGPTVRLRRLAIGGIETILRQERPPGPLERAVRDRCHRVVGGEHREGSAERGRPSIRPRGSWIGTSVARHEAPGQAVAVAVDDRRPRVRTHVEPTVTVAWAWLVRLFWTISPTVQSCPSR